jgi:hypothetical protein
MKMANIEMTFQVKPVLDCDFVGHDFRLTLADRVPRGSAIHSNRPATFTVTACSRCGELQENYTPSRSHSYRA